MTSNVAVQLLIPSFHTSDGDIETSASDLGTRLGLQNWLRSFRDQANTNSHLDLTATLTNPPPLDSPIRPIICLYAGCLSPANDSRPQCPNQ